MRAIRRCVLGVLLCAEFAVAEDTVEQAAQKVVAAVEAEDRQAVEALAARDSPEPWCVVDDLCALGRYDAARAFATAAGRPDTAALADYVEAQRKRPTPQALRDGFDAANAHYRAGRYAEAIEATAGLDVEGADLTAVRILGLRAMSIINLGRSREGVQRFLATARAAEELGWLSQLARILEAAFVRSTQQFDWDTAERTALRWIQLEERRGRDARLAMALGNLAMVYQNRGRYEEAIERLERAIETATRANDTRHQAWACAGLALVLYRMGRPRDAIPHSERALELYESIEDLAGVAKTVGELGVLQLSLGEADEAFRYQQRSLALHKQAGDPSGIALSTMNLACVHDHLGRRTEALRGYQEALRVFERIRDASGTCDCLVFLGGVLTDVGRLEEAHTDLRRALELARRTGQRHKERDALGTLGVLYESMGDFAGALRRYEQCLELSRHLKDRKRVAMMLGNLGAIHSSLCAYEEALRVLSRALRIYEELDDRSGQAFILRILGETHYELGSPEASLQSQERALELFEQEQNPHEMGRALANIGTFHAVEGDYDKALSYLERSRELMVQVGAPEGQARALVTTAMVHLRRGKFELQLACAREARSICERTGSTDVLVRAITTEALGLLALGRWQETVATARAALEMTAPLVRGLAEEEGMTVRQHWLGPLSDVGAAASCQLADPREASFFIESGRAGALLESLKGRDALARAALPPELLEAEREAKVAFEEASTSHSHAVRGGVLATIRESRAKLDESRSQLLAVVNRVQREAKAAAQLVYPRPDPLDEIQRSLRPGEALVSYCLPMKWQGIALVVTEEDARLVMLAKVSELKEAADELVRVCGTGRGPARDVEEPIRFEPAGSVIDRLRDLLMSPLRLDESVRRILVSPCGSLSRVPFAAIAGDRAVAYVPSGTTLGLLRKGAPKRGKEVLALGDPAYGSQRRFGMEVPRLPATREEARAVGGTVLLGEEATETGLRRTLETRERWRAVHLACHGLIDPRRPLLSSLALARDEEHDGFLALLDVLRMRIPAGLVVLSACETARGRVFEAEGVVGFPRALLFAGASRVIVSLWKVDDEATKALMVKFYELWKPGKVATATALKRAQEYVASHEKWKHPYYWAAWQLWGIPD